MEYLLLILAILFLIIGIVGSILPGLPGLPISWLGILCLSFMQGVEVSTMILWSSFLLMLLISILDYVIPAQGTKRFGGSKYGVWGTNIGLVIGILTPVPFGFIIGPFIGAFLGELYFDSSDTSRAFKSAVGSFIGFLLSTFMKIFVSFGFLVLGIYLVAVNWQQVVN